MTRFKASVSASVLTIFLSSAAYAADIYHKGGSLKDEPNQEANFDSPRVNWTGLYIGGQAGKSFVVLGDEEGQGGLSVDGFNGGGQIGFDLARGRFVFGISGEYNFSDGALEAFGFTIFEKDHDMSGCGRLGYIATPSVLVYAKGCYSQMEMTAGPMLGGGSETFDGVGARAGIEYAAWANTFVGIEAGHTWYDENNKLPSGVSLDETTIMGTLKIKLNGFGWAN